MSVLRASLADVAARATVGQDGALSYDAVEVAVVYFRAGYTPDDYPGVAEWEARRTIGRFVSMVFVVVLADL